MQHRPDMFLRHILACRAGRPAANRMALRIGGRQAGWLDPSALPEVLACGGVLSGAAVELPDGAALPEMARRLVAAGACRCRDEAFDVRAFDGSVVGVIDRGALPVFGFEAWGVHINGLVRRADGLHLWVARRGDDRPLDPGKLDHIVAGGIPAGLTADETVVKEAAEEAAIPAALAATASPVAQIPYCLERPEGLRRDRLFCYDLDLPEDFVPHPADAEMAGFELWPISRVAETVAGTDDFKFNVNLVLIDLLIRLGVLAPAPFRVMYDEPGPG